MPRNPRTVAAIKASPELGARLAAYWAEVVQPRKDAAKVAREAVAAKRATFTEALPLSVAKTQGQRNWENKRAHDQAKGALSRAVKWYGLGKSGYDVLALACRTGKPEHWALFMRIDAAVRAMAELRPYIREFSGNFASWQAGQPYRVAYSNAERTVKYCRKEYRATVAAEGLPGLG